MTYMTVATFAQVASLLFFITAFLAVLVYALWPGNKARFDAAQREALDLNSSEKNGGGAI